MSLFKGKSVRFWCDNEAVVYMLIKMRSSLRRPDLQIVINDICECLIDNDINLRIEHIPGKENTTADRLSRYKSDPIQFPSYPNLKQVDVLTNLKRANLLGNSTKVKKSNLHWENKE